MSKPADVVIELSPTLTLCEYKTGGDTGLWLYDKTRGMNLAMRADSERDAFIKALSYYQRRLLTIEHDHRVLKEKVDAFVSEFREDDD